MAKPAPTADTPSQSGKLPVILAATVVLLGAGGYVGYRQMAEHEVHEGSTGPLPVEDDPGLIEMEPIVVNLADTAGDRYLRLTVRLMLSQKSVAAAADEGLANVKLRDTLLSVLSKKRASDLVSPENKEKLRGEVARAVEVLLAEPPLAAVDGSTPPCHVMEVFFTEFLLQ